MRFTQISGLCLLAACHPAAPATSRLNTSFAPLGGAHAVAQNDLQLNDAGSGVAATFRGTGVALDLRNDKPGERVYYQVTLDNTTQKVVQLSTRAQRYTFDDLAPGVHQLVVRRLNGQRAGTGHVTSPVLLNNGEFIVATQAARRVEFVGDDLMTGAGLEDMDDAFAWTANAALSVAGQTAKGLQADYRVREADGWSPAHHWQPQAVVVQMHDHVDLTVRKIHGAYPQAEIFLMLAPGLEGEALQGARREAAATGLRVVEFGDPEANRGDSYGHYVMARTLRGALLGLSAPSLSLLSRSPVEPSGKPL